MVEAKCQYVLQVLESVMYDLRVAIVHDDKHPEKVSALVKHDFTWSLTD